LRDDRTHEAFVFFGMPEWFWINCINVITYNDEGHEISVGKAPEDEKLRSVLLRGRGVTYLGHGNGWEIAKGVPYPQVLASLSAATGIEVEPKMWGPLPEPIEAVLAGVKVFCERWVKRQQEWMAEAEEKDRRAARLIAESRAREANRAPPPPPDCG